MDSKEESNRIANIIEELSELDNEIRLSVKPAILVKSALIRISNSVSKSNDSDNKSSLANVYDNSKIEKLENEINKLYSILNNSKIERKVNNTAVESIIEDKKVSQTNTSNQTVEKTVNQDNIKPFKNYEEFKNTIVSKGKIKLFSTLAGSTMYLSDENAIIVTSNEFAYKMLIMDEQKNIISEMLKAEYNIDKPVTVKLKKQSKESKIEQILKDNSIEYTDLD
jgi:hypothetical protein